MTTEYVIDTDSVAEANCATGTEATDLKRRSVWMVIGFMKRSGNDDMPEADTETKLPPVPMDIGQLIVDRAKPVIRAAGYAYEGPLAAERWARLPGGDWIVLLKLGIGDRYMHLRCATLYTPQVGNYFHTRDAAEKAYEEATRHSFVAPVGPHERFASSEAKAMYEREMAEFVEEGRRRKRASEGPPISP
jgi:hypothetical protein